VRAVDLGGAFSPLRRCNFVHPSNAQASIIQQNRSACLTYPTVTPVDYDQRFTV
jgi:hypothetical protein